MKAKMVFFIPLICVFNTSFMTIEKTYSMLCLGDSYTIGEAVEESERFPMQTFELLKRKGFYFEKPTIIAKTGWTTDELSAAVKEANLKGRYDVVTLLIGVNNQYRGREIEIYRKEFRELLKTSIDYASGNLNHVFVISIPDWGVTPFGANDKRGEKKIGEEIDLFNAIGQQESHDAKVHYIDITSFSRAAKGNVELLANDGLHPSGKMYKVWAEKLANAVEETQSK